MTTREPHFGTGDDLRAALLAKMPFGRFEGERLMDLPFPYLCWFEREGWPRGKLGAQMAVVYELQHNDYEMLVELRKLLNHSP
ncbi:MAG: DUF3820 family protein [Myxococcota bacterium]